MDKNNNHTGRVILTYGRSLMALTAAHSLGKRGIEVIGCDDVDMTVLKFSNYVSDYFVHPPYQEDVDTYLDALEEQIKKFKPDDDRPYILMPMFRDAKILAKYKERFEPLIKVATIEHNTINKISPKDVFANTCEKNGLDIPITFQPQSEGDVKNLQDKIKYPILVKTPDGVGGRGIHKAHDQKELLKLYSESEKEFGTPPLIQEVIDGEDYCLTAIADKGEIITSMAYKNLYQYPRDTGAGIMRETIDDAPFIHTASQLLQSLNWHGIAQIDFRWSGKDEDAAYLIESNPRFWAGLFHSVESGADYPWLLYQLTAYGKITDIEDIAIGKRTKVNGLWAIPAVQDIIDNSTNFDQLKETWAQIWDENNDETWRARFAKLSQSFKESISIEDLKKSYAQMHDKSNSAVSEFSAQDDPKTSLGFLFIISSLLKHGELPPELK